MSGSTPSDLAVTFRSLARRQREAIGDVNPAAVAGLNRELDGHVHAAADLLGAGRDPTAVADAIEQRPAEDWDDATLEALRQHALEAGAVLRRIAREAESLRQARD